MDHWIATLSYLVGAIWIVTWATLRALGPAKGQYLQSDWVLAARFIYVFCYLVIFIGGTGIFVFGGKLGADLAKEVSETFAFLGHLKDVLGGETAPLAPVFAICLIHIGLKLEPVNKMDRRVLAWLHSTEHLEDEMQKLRAALETSSFEPSEVQIAENRRKLLDYDVRITDNGLISGHITVVTQWRKVACLLRLVNAWQASSTRVLNPAQEAELRDIEKTDNRKTAHAFDIIRALRHSQQQGQEPGVELQGAEERGVELQPFDARAEWSPAWSSSRSSGAGAGQVMALLPEYLPNRPGAGYMLEIDSAEFANYIRKIQNYFLEEYDILLRRISTLAANAIVYSGEDAAGRLQKIKEAGYYELGEINRLTIDNIVKLFCLTIIIVVSVFFLFLLFSSDLGPNVVVVLKIGLIYAFAILCGAMIGTNRTLVRRPHTPWAAFVAAGLMSFLLFLFVHFSIAMTQAFIAAVQTMAQGSGEDIFANLSFGKVQTDKGKVDVAFKDILPWALLPTFASVAICRISRIRWPERVGRFGQRLLDGLVLAGVFVLGSMLVFALHIHLGTLMARRLEVEGVLQWDWILRGMTVTSALGFLMGSTAIADIRKIAKSEIFNGGQSRRPAPAAWQRQSEIPITIDARSMAA